MEIEAGDTVEYITVGQIKVGKEGKQLKTIKIALHGIWDGKQVILDDKERTTVYKKEWLTRYYSRKELIQTIEDLYVNHIKETLHVYIYKKEHVIKDIIKSANHGKLD